jgi:hypothetical protein
MLRQRRAAVALFALFSAFSFQVSAFSFVPHVRRIQTHRPGSGDWNGFERAVGCCARAFQLGPLKRLNEIQYRIRIPLFLEAPHEASGRCLH